MRRVRLKQTKDQRGTGSAAQRSISLDDGTVTTPAALAIMQAVIPPGLRAVEEALLAEVQRLAGPRYARNDDRPAVVRRGAQSGSIFLADQKVPITVPRVRDRAAQCEVPLATYAALQTPRASDLWGCEARPRSPVSRVARAERIGGGEPRRRARGNADTPPVAGVSRTRRELPVVASDRARHGPARGNHASGHTLAHP